MLDGARAIQFLRHKAAELGIDPDRIAASGSSAGAGIALWVAFHDDLADPKSPDPVAQRSSRVCCLGVDGAQTSYDPRFIKSLIGGRTHEHSALRPFFGVKSDADSESPRILKLYEEASPINYVTADDPPVILFYAEPNAPLPADAKPGQGIHHPRFGQALKARLDPLAVECILRHWEEYPKQDNHTEDMCRDMTKFFTRHFGTK
jgi:acetyl esterase